MREALRGPLWRVDDLLGRLVARLQDAGLIARAPEPYDGLESAVQLALRPVAPSSGFRRALGSNLTFAAQGQQAGLAIEHRRPLRLGIILGISAGLLTAAVATLVVVLRSHAPSAED